MAVARPRHLVIAGWPDPAGRPATRTTSLRRALRGWRAVCGPVRHALVYHPLTSIRPRLAPPRGGALRDPDRARQRRRRSRALRTGSGAELLGPGRGPADSGRPTGFAGRADRALP